MVECEFISSATVVFGCTRNWTETLSVKVYNTTFIRWTTHSPSGLSEKDVIMAKYCDEQSEKCGEVENAETSAVGKELADRVATEGGDCCAPKRKEPPPAL